VFLGEKIRKVDTEISAGDKIKQNGELLPSFSTLPLASSPPLAVHPTSSLSKKTSELVVSHVTSPRPDGMCKAEIRHGR
jgi:hypothetical protein